MLERLKKLRGKSLAEIGDRGVQQTNKVAERLGISAKSRLLTDEQMMKKFGLRGKRSSAIELLEHFRSRTSAIFYSSFDEPVKTIAVLRERFPLEESPIIERADKILRGRFDLLGYKDLYFGGVVPDWHLEPVSATRSPRIHWSRINELDPEQTGDKKIIWELNRHQYFSTLGRAYWLTNDEKYAETWIAHLASWFANNPPKIGVNWLSSLEIAFRSISWIWAVNFFKDSPNLTPEILARLLKFLYLNGRHLETYLSTHFSPNTHLTGEALGLYFLGTFLPELEDGRRWKETGYKILLDALDFQVRPDGVYCEQSSHYQRYTADFFANLLIMRYIEGAQVDPKLEEKLGSLMTFLMYITQPNGEIPLFGDDDGGRFYFLDETKLSDFRPTLALGAALLGRGDLKYLAKDAGPELLWLLGPDGLGRFDDMAATEPKEKTKAFPAGGFFVHRESWSDSSAFALIDCGPHGFLNGGHAHADALAFVLSVQGVPVFIDSGTFSYMPGPAARDLFRSSLAHNCATVNRCSSSEPGGLFSWTSTANAQLLEWTDKNGAVEFHGSHDGFERFGVAYERHLEFHRDVILLRDVFESENVNLFELHFILSTDVDAKVRATPTEVAINSIEGIEILAIETDAVGENIDRAGEWRLEKWSVSSHYGKKSDSKKLVFSVSARGTLTIKSRLVKKSASDSPDTSAYGSDNPAMADRGRGGFPVDAEKRTIG